MAAPTESPPLDRDSQAWIDQLSTRQPAAIQELHALLLKAARFEVNRRAAASPSGRRDDLDDLAHQSADDALVAVLAKLGDFRGDSRFTTWAYKFALLEAGVKARRRAWQGREVPLTSEGWATIAGDDPSPHEGVETSELLGALRQAIEDDLSPRQREILVAVVVNGVPIDVLAERLGSTRGALYKSIHDARAKLRATLADRGHIS